MLAAVSRIQALTLAGTADSAPSIPGSRVYDQMLPAEDVIQFPCVLVTIEGERETIRPATNLRGDWGYPVRAQICDRADNNEKLPRGKYLKWREQIALAFEEQRLPGVTEVFNCLIEPAVIVDPKLPSYKYFVSGLTLRFIARRARGLT